MLVVGFALGYTVCVTLIAILKNGNGSGINIQSKGLDSLLCGFLDQWCRLEAVKVAFDQVKPNFIAVKAQNNNNN